MVDDTEVRQQVLRNTIEESSHRGQKDPSAVADPCVICLDQVSEKAAARPCNHDSFDFLCLVSWLQERPACPLCQTSVKYVSYDLESENGSRVYQVGYLREESKKRTHISEEPLAFHPRARRPPRRQELQSPAPSDTLIRRRYIYRYSLYSLRVGSNRLSKFRELTPQEFIRDEDLVSRARKWIRRELQIFEFLNPDTATGPPSEQPLRRANNAEFLLEYIIAILKTVDIKGSGGQAEELLQEFLGRQNTRLFLHELQAWLRSPYNSLEDWDRAVQYDEGRSSRFNSQEATLDLGDTALDSRYRRQVPLSTRTSPHAVRKSNWHHEQTGRRELSRRLESTQSR